jgi:hypothetical protein
MKPLELLLTNICIAQKHPILLSSILLLSCLGLDEKAPDCYPNEGCEMGYRCEAGRCIAPPIREITVKANCIASNSCQDQLIQLADNEEKKAYFCLALEQPTHTYWLELTSNELNQSDMIIRKAQRLNEGALRAQLFAFSTPCPTDQAGAQALGLPQLCKIENGCLFRLRHEELSIVSQDISLDFSADEGQCKELTWSVNQYIMPKETCADQEDNDCDGFIDEGSSCLRTDSEIDSSTSPMP